MLYLTSFIYFHSFIRLYHYLLSFGCSCCFYLQAATYLDIKGLVRLTLKNMRGMTLEQSNRLSDLRWKNIKDVMRALKDSQEIQYFNIEEELVSVLAMRTSEELRIDLNFPFA